MFAKQITSSLFRNLKNSNISIAKMSSIPTYKTLQITVPKPFVYHVEMNRPEKLNCMNKIMWIEFGNCFENLNNDPDCRVIILSGAGRLFCAGIDLSDMVNLGAELAEHEDIARKAKILESLVKLYQRSFTSIELCNKPVISAVHNACIGAGVDMITATDMRHCTKDAYFQVKEVDIGMAADVGTLQRLPKVIGSDSLARDLCYTARKLPSDEALQCGLISKVYADKESMMGGVLKLAEEIAAKSPVAVQGTKRSLVYSRDHTVQEGLNHIGMWNATMLTSEDFIQAAMAQATKQKDITFAKL